MLTERKGRCCDTVESTPGDVGSGTMRAHSTFPAPSLKRKRSTLADLSLSINTLNKGLDINNRPNPPPFASPRLGFSRVEGTAAPLLMKPSKPNAELSPRHKLGDLERSDEETISSQSPKLPLSVSSLPFRGQPKPIIGLPPGYTNASSPYYTRTAQSQNPAYSTPPYTAEVSPTLVECRQSQRDEQQMGNGSFLVISEEHGARISTKRNDGFEGELIEMYCTIEELLDWGKRWATAKEIAKTAAKSQTYTRGLEEEQVDL